MVLMLMVEEGRELAMVEKRKGKEKEGKERGIMSFANAEKNDDMSTKVIKVGWI